MQVFNFVLCIFIFYFFLDFQDILFFFVVLVFEKLFLNYYKFVKWKVVFVSMDNEKRRKMGEFEKLKINEEDQVLELKRF